MYRLFSAFTKSTKTGFTPPSSRFIGNISNDNPEVSPTPLIDLLKEAYSNASKIPKVNPRSRRKAFEKAGEILDQFPTIYIDKLAQEDNSIKEMISNIYLLRGQSFLVPDENFNPNKAVSDLENIRRINASSEYEKLLKLAILENSDIDLKEENPSSPSIKSK